MLFGCLNEILVYRNLSGFHVTARPRVAVFIQLINFLVSNICQLIINWAIEIFIGENSKKRELVLYFKEN